MEEEKIFCPYDSAHTIIASKMAIHLTKCRREHKCDEFVICPFNSIHRIPSPEYKYHIENCKDNRKLNIFTYDSDSLKLNSVVYDIELPTSSENWDEESTEQKSYLDVKNEMLKKKQVFCLPVGMSKSKRKDFFKQEVKKFNKTNKYKQ